MPVNDTTSNRGYQKPNVANALSYDVGRLRSALDSIDTDMAGKASLATAQSFTAAQRGSVTALTSAATVTADFAVANNYSLLLAHNVVLANPTNLTAGQSGAVVITQAASGGPYTVSYGSYWKFPGGTVPSKASTSSSVCVLLYYVESTTRITAQLLNDVKV